MWSTERNTIEITVEAGDVRAWTFHKKLYTGFAQFHAIIGNMQNHPTCVSTGVRSLYPSTWYMGFDRKQDEDDNVAVEIEGNKIKGLKWVKTMEGDYKDKSTDMAWQKRSHQEDK